jgi:hypothetical protein
MKKLLLIFATICGLAFGAHAQAADVALSPIDCSVLSGTTYICVRNARPTSITAISCKGFWGESFVSLPGGSIAAGGTAVVDFNMGKCNKAITVKVRDGQQFDINGFDVTTNTTLNISNQ